MKINKQSKQTLFLFFVFTLIITFLFNPYVSYLVKSMLTNQPLSLAQVYIIQDDWIQQGIPFYNEFFTLLDQGNLSWSWNLFLGNGFFVSKAVLYMTSDIFAYLGYAINKFIHFVPTTLFILTCIKCYIAGFSFNYLLQKYNLDFKTRILFSSLFIATGWSLIFIEHPVFLSFYCLTPLLFASIEDVLQKNKFIPLICIAGLLIATNYYLAWSMCIYLLIYWIVRYFVLNEFDAKAFLTLSMKTVGAFLLGVLISAAIWLPSLMYMVNSPRLVTSGITTTTTWSTTNILAILMNFFIPVTKFDQTLYHDMWYYFYQIGIYCGILPLLLIPQFFTQSRSKREKTTYGLLLFFTCITLSTPLIGLLFHFTFSLRYTIIFNFTLLLIAALTLNQHQKVNAKVLLFSEAILCLLILFLGVFLPLRNGLDLSSYPEIKMLLVALGFSLIYTVLLLCIDSKKTVLNVLIIVAICESMFQGNQAILSYSSNEITKATYLTQQQDVQTAYQRLKEVDPTFTRINLQVDETIPEVDTTNFGLYYGIPTLKTYDSLYNYETFQLLNYTRQYPEVNWIFTFEEPAFFEMLSAKYTITTSDTDPTALSYFAEEITIPGVPEGYKIYQHTGDFAIAKTHNSFISHDAMLTMAKDDQIYLHELAATLTNNIIIDSSLIESLQQHYGTTTKQSFNPTNMTNNSMAFEINVTEDSFVYFSIPYSEGWTIRINGVKGTPLHVNGGFIGLELKKGVNEVTFNYTVPYLTTGFTLSLLGLILVMILSCRKQISRLIHRNKA